MALSLVAKLWNKSIAHLMKRPIKDLVNSQHANAYMQYLVWMIQQLNNKECKFQLYSVIRDHFKSCRDSRCLCFLLRYKVFHLPGENIFKGMEKLNKNKKQEKLILYDYECGIEWMSQEHDFLIQEL